MYVKRFNNYLSYKNEKSPLEIIIIIFYRWNLGLRVLVFKQQYLTCEFEKSWHERICPVLSLFYINLKTTVSNG